jgi:drug/metabolite transporter (DMT)-like permease
VISYPRLRDWALLLFCNFIWASLPSLFKVVQAQMGPQQMGPICAYFFPMAMASILLIPLVQRELRAKKLSGEDVSVPLRDILQFILLGVCGAVVAQLFVSWGVRYSPASNASLIYLAAPIITALMAHFLLGERMTAIRWISFALAIAGVVVCSGVIGKGSSLVTPKFILGNFMFLLAVNGSAFYNVYGKRLLRQYSPLRVSLYSYYAVLGFSLPIALYMEPEGFRNLAHYSLGVWAGLLALALFGYFLATIVFFYVLTRLDATQAGLSNYLMPFFGLLIAGIFLHERLTTFMMAGGILVLVSTLMITVYEERRRAHQADPAKP